MQGARDAPCEEVHQTARLRLWKLEIDRPRSQWVSEKFVSQSPYFLLFGGSERLERLITLGAQHDLVLPEQLFELPPVVAPPVTFQFLNHHFDHHNVIPFYFATAAPKPLCGRSGVRRESSKTLGQSGVHLRISVRRKAVASVVVHREKDLNEVRHDVMRHSVAWRVPLRALRDRRPLGSS